MMGVGTPGKHPDHELLALVAEAQELNRQLDAAPAELERSRRQQRLPPKHFVCLLNDGPRMSTPIDPPRGHNRSTLARG